MAARKPRVVPPAEPVVFVDRVYRARVLRLSPDGAVKIEGGRVATSDPDEIAALDAHADFERAEGGGE